MRSAVDIPGPWQHRFVAANGARFHVAESLGGQGGAPLVLFLHGFPEFWWCWRHQLPAVAGAGFRAAAMDLRGYGGSDKPPRGYDPVTLAGDVSGVVKALGARSAVVVGHGWGGYVGWATAALHREEVAALAAVSAPHPMQMLRRMWRGGSATAVRHVLAMQVPMLPERRLSDARAGTLRRHLQAWSGPGTAFPDEEAIAHYQAALRMWPAPHCALEYHRWLLRSRLRSDGRRFNQLMQEPVRQPVLLVSGALDPVLPGDTGTETGTWAAGPVRRHLMDGVGHFPAEERPAAFTGLLVDWLQDLAAGGEG